jgi:3D (Asp-Asp-Asp) domain-containing protein
MALIGCRKRAREFRDAPGPGISRGSFALTYYWASPGDPENTVGVKDMPLVPFVSVAVDPNVIPIGTHLYISELDGVVLPGGATHDGCAIAMDVGSKIRGQKIDWFVLAKDHYKALDPRLKLTHVTVHDGGMRCD